MWCYIHVLLVDNKIITYARYSLIILRTYITRHYIFTFRIVLRQFWEILASLTLFKLLWANGHLHLSVRNNLTFTFKGSHLYIVTCLETLGTIARIQD